MRQFEVALRGVRESLLEMAGVVEAAIGQSSLALAERNAAHAPEVFQHEKRINRMQIDIDQTALSLLAMHQLVARDLRFLTAVVKINSDLERMGDEAVNIAYRSQLLNEYVKLPVDILGMAKLVQSMVREALDSFAKSEAMLARSVLESDDAVDEFRDLTHRELIKFMQGNPEAIPECVNVIFVAQSLERIADHATNIAEDVLFLVDGVEVRHHADVAV